MAKIIVQQMVYINSDEKFTIAIGLTEGVREIMLIIVSLTPFLL